MGLKRSQFEWRDCTLKGALWSVTKCRTQGVIYGVEVPAVFYFEHQANQHRFE
jgi:hypothetical protein